jgi:hypothetical protein
MRQLVAHRVGHAGRFRRILTALILAAGLVGVPAVLSVASASTAAAAAGVAPGTCGNVLLAGPAWLGGQGVAVKSNGADQGSGTSCGGTNTVDGVKTGSEWQCVELVNRLYVTRGWIKATWPGNGGRSSASARNSMYDEAPSSLSKQPNGSISHVGPGDVVSINVYDNGVFQADGHVLVVNAPATITSGSVPLVSQNGGSSSGAIVTSTATLSGGTLTIPRSGNWTYSVIGVVHAPGGGGSAVRAVVTSDGHVQLFEVSDGVVEENWYSPANGAVGDWVSPGALPGGAQAAGNPAIVPRSGQQVIDVFVRSSAGQILETWYNWGNGSWGGWIAIAGSTFTGDPQAVATSDGHDQVFADDNGVIEQNWFAPASGAIGDWVTI